MSQQHTIPHRQHSSSQAKRIMPKLGWAGVLPFVFLAILGVFVPTVSLNLLLVGKYSPVLVSVADVFAVYSAMILSFMSGTLWGRLIGANELPASVVKVSVVTNMVMLSAFALLLFGLLGYRTMTVTLIGLGFGFAFLRWFEHRTLDAHLPTWYVSMRRGLTWTVVVCHVVLLVGRWWLS